MAKDQSDAELQACHVFPLPEGRERNESPCRPDIKRGPYQERQYSLPEPSPQACCLVVRPPVPHQKEWTAPVELPSQVWFGRGLAHRWPNNMDSVSVSVRELHDISKLGGNDASLWNRVLWLEGPTHPSSSPRSIICWGHKRDTASSEYSHGWPNAEQATEMGCCGGPPLLPVWVCGSTAQGGAEGLHWLGVLRTP